MMLKGTLLERLPFLLFAVLLLTGVVNCRQQTNKVDPLPGKTAGQTASKGGDTPMLLVFSKTTGYRHASIKEGIAAISKLAAEHAVKVESSEDSTLFTIDNLARYKAVVFLSTTGDILDANQKAAFEHYIHAGGGYAGIHAASDTEYHWPWYGQLMGAFFKSHPQIQSATLHVEDSHHPSTSLLPHTWVRTDEWYNYASNPRATVHTLLTLDESTYHGGEMGNDHPISWYHTFDGGRSWYTGLGHTPESFSEPLFLAHLWGGISYAAGLTKL